MEICKHPDGTRVLSSTASYTSAELCSDSVAPFSSRDVSVETSIDSSKVLGPNESMNHSPKVLFVKSRPVSVDRGLGDDRMVFVAVL
jgi:hypothetical protein